MMGLGQGPIAISLPGLHEICSPPAQCPLWEVMQLEGGLWDKIITEKTDGRLSNPPLLSVPENPSVWPQGQEGVLFQRELVTTFWERGAGQSCLSHPFCILSGAFLRTVLTGGIVIKAHSRLP